MVEIAAIILAAGESRRWGKDNKLLVPVDGMPMLQRTIQTVQGSRARPVIVVIGHEADLVQKLLEDPSISVIAASDFAQGLSASLKTGVAAVPRECSGALICLGDMPWVQPVTLDRLIEAWDARRDKEALVPTYRGEWGNPVLLGRGLFPEIGGLTGDRGARALLMTEPGRISEVPVDDPGVLRDVDQPGALV